jgi:hypothetical protein
MFWTPGLRNFEKGRQVERQVAYANDPVRLLRPLGERRGEEDASESPDERPTFDHSIT